MLVSEPGIEIPDECPKICAYNKDLVKFGQNAKCFECPIFNCNGKKPILQPQRYKYNWAVEWKRFFDGETKNLELLPKYTTKL